MGMLSFSEEFFQAAECFFHDFLAAEVGNLIVKERCGVAFVLHAAFRREIGTVFFPCELYDEGLDERTAGLNPMHVVHVKLVAVRRECDFTDFDAENERMHTVIPWLCFIFIQHPFIALFDGVVVRDLFPVFLQCHLRRIRNQCLQFFKVGKAKSGGNMSVLKNGTIMLSGGSIKNGTATAEKSGENYSGGHGGNISVSGTFKMTGGTVSGVTVKDGQANRGGNIHVANTATLTQTRGTVSGGKSDENAGNIYIGRGSTYILKDGEVKDGVATKDAGNIRVDGTFQMEGGLVANGSANGSTESESANVQMIRQDEKTAINMTGGEIKGYVSLNRLSGTETTPFVTLGGTAKVVGGKGIAYPSSANENYFLLNPLESGAEIWLRTPSNGTNAFAVAGSGFTDAMCSRINIQSEDYVVVKKADGKIYVRSTSVKLQCICGCTNAAALFTQKRRSHLRNGRISALHGV